MLLLLTWVVVIITAVVLYLRQTYSYLRRDGINHLPTIPFFGNLFWVMFQKEHFVDLIAKVTNAFPDDKIVGNYDMMTPILIIRDLEMLKRVTVKDFEHFIDRRSFTSELDPMFGRGLLLLHGDEWKAMRSTMSPAFTSSKIRLMVPFMEEVCLDMIKVLKQRIKDSGTSYYDMECKEVMTRYANDVIASCAFGLKVDSLTADSEFYVNSKAITKFTFWRFMKVMFYRLFPSVAGMMQLSLVPKETTDYFTNVVLGTMKNREQNKIVRNDMINILMEVKKGQLTHEKEGKDADAGFATVEESHIGKKPHNYEWTDTDLVAQAALFLFAGFDTISTAMSFILYELALNQDVQERLVREIREYDAKNNGKLDYNSIQNMTYLDMVVSEGMRLWPAAPFMDRVCVNDYNIGRPNKEATKDLIIRKGQCIVIPAYALHRDPEYFPNPTKFDPERFSHENRDKIVPFTYLPFGLGPRNCIGSRFALCEVKVMLYLLLRDLKLTTCDKTPVPARLSKNGFEMLIYGGAWVRLSVRTE
ncbi:cytochrome P450 9e2-like [Spodoptera frugiperda]|uniref:unspecific monooxygenase n=2 Tax=Spodoptera frugiperda TaxID=7108 RepID=A0A9R0E9G1_SPOFR|nr:cytochrome P450 9e2-like [Spodoptera frugiperda]XP_050560870.1 cytochrome P450 9e2-like [Spodoptera frugiperda]XP_050560871.1 cytochrome P450 9e2-like [Spodoptera frugiperda]XP_050560872.1 cytochrome P450 9e2-like [Spodoptera frugiperda]